jgi:hypothetical protein
MSIGAGVPSLSDALGIGMNEDAEAARRYRNRAKEVRAIAAGAKDRKTRLSLFRVATDYLDMAWMRIRVGKADRDSNTGHSKEPEGK